MPIRVYRCRLPHWRLEGATYFVTWRLHRRQAGLCMEERLLVLETLRHFNTIRFDLVAAVVMDDHVHVIVTVKCRSLEAAVRDWKSYSARGLRTQGRLAPYWQSEYYDRIIRSESDLEEKVRYVAQNPTRRWQGITNYPALWICD